MLKNRKPDLLAASVQIGRQTYRRKSPLKIPPNRNKLTTQ
uniref:Uncharacterized protein n=1 Tax=Vibrio splendidus TaxID=29497 RepID=A0A0H3ZV05_VIBSP|nr:hypothetical protein [Vibrio splendidus]